MLSHLRPWAGRTRIGCGALDLLHGDPSPRTISRASAPDTTKHHTESQSQNRGPTVETNEPENAQAPVRGANVRASLEMGSSFGYAATDQAKMSNQFRNLAVNLRKRANKETASLKAVDICESNADSL